MKIVIVDPIFKASRLYYSTLAAKASNQMGYKPVVLTRNYSNTEHYVEMMEKVDHDLIEICDLPEDFWYGKIDASQLTLVFRQIEIMAADDELIVYFSGLNEIWPEIVDVVKKQFASLSNVHMIFVEYHPEYLLNIGARIRASGLLHYLKQYVRIFKHKQIQLQRFRELDKASFSYDIIVLDERIHEKRMGAIPRFLKSKVHVNCDPAQSPLLSTVTTVVKDSITLLSVGLQSRRKGLVQIIRLAELAKIQSLPIRIRIVGRLEKDTEFLRSRIASASNIEFIEGYFSDEEIAQQYNDCDCVLLPYARSFNSSSGVLANAVAAKKPVISSDHGLIGHRVTKHKLGYTFPYEDIVQFSHTVQKLTSDFIGEKMQYREMQNNVATFYELISEAAHIENIKNIFVSATTRLSKPST